MPCGPLQAMQIYALSTRSPVAGAIAMFLFCLGTVPLMFGLGVASTALGKKFTSKAITVGAVLVVVLGMSMFTQGYGLSGIRLPFISNPNVPTHGFEPNIVDGVQIVNSTLLADSFPNIIVKVGIPVKWIIDAPDGSINLCNNQMIINEYGIDYLFKEGENIIEFMPIKSGIFQYSCWMGMIRAHITVVT
jgi:hypothetical protein